MMIATCIAAVARQAPEAVAVLFGAQQVTYGRLAAEIDRVAAGLARAGLAPGATLGIRIHHPYWHWVFLLAGMRLGARTLSLSATAAHEQETVGGIALLAHDSTNRELPAPGAARLMLTEPWLKGALAAEPIGLPDPAAADAAFGRWVFSSGTTGRPKGVLLDRRLLEPRIAVNLALYGIDRATRLRMGLGIETIAGFQAPLATWIAGGTLVIFRKPESAADDFRRHRPTMVITSPYGLQQALPVMPELLPGDGPVVVVMGGTLPIALRDRAVARLGCHVEVRYGSTETGMIAFGDAAVLDRHPGAVGFVSPDAAVEIVDDQGHPLPDGSEGEVRTRSNGMVGGYLGRADEDAAVFRDGWFHPGDRGILFPDGLLAVTGRVVELLNIGGTKLAPGDVEAAACGAPGVVEACALMLPRAGGVAELAIALRLEPGAEMAAVRRHLATAMPTLTAFRLIGVEAIPRNAMGKVPRLEFADGLARRLRDGPA